MADTKITALTALTAADPANDVIPIVDVSDTTMAASGTTKKISVNNILGASGTATLASATITGAATVGTTLGVTGNSTLTGSVGIGVAPAQKLTVLVADGAQVAQFRGASGYVRLRSYVDATNGGILDSTNTTESAYVNLTIQAASLRLFGGGASGLTINANSDATVLTGNLIIGTSGKGIDFSATANSSGTMTSELLNDYEEGTFTPTVIGSTTAGVGVYAVQGGRYTKIGNLVTIQVYLGWSAHTGTGNMRFGNFPFTTSSDSASNNGVSFGYVHNIALSASNVLTGFTSVGTTYVDAHQYPVGGGASAAVPIDTAGDVIFTASYRV